MTTPYEEGNPQSKIAVLGEAPGGVEMKLGRPLIGPAGDLFNDCLHKAGIIRQECYLTNVFETPVTKNRAGDTFSHKETGETLWSTKRGFTEYGEELSQPALSRLNATEANVIIPLGACACDLLTNKHQIMKWRGSPLPSQGLDRVRTVVPSRHPAASLRGDYLLRYIIICDFKKAKRHSRMKKYTVPSRMLRVAPSVDLILAYLKEIKKTKRCSIDIEVVQHNIWCVGFGVSALNAMCIPFVGENRRPYFSLEDEARIWIAINDIMSDPTITKINQNILFDITVLRQLQNIKTIGPLCDTMVAQHILYPDFLKGLDFITSIHTDEPYYKDEGKFWKNPGEDITDFWLYNCKDCAVAFESWEVLSKELDDFGQRDTHDFTVSMYLALEYMMLRGIKVNHEELTKTKEAVKYALEEKQKTLLEAADYEFNPASPKQCQEYFYGHKGIKPYISRTTGRPTTDDKAMVRIARRFNLPEARLVQDVRGLSKLLGTYLEIQFDRDGRLRCSYNPRGTTTGRLSSSKTVFDTGMNMQNLDARFKGFLVADDDN